MFYVSKEGKVIADGDMLYDGWLKVEAIVNEQGQLREKLVTYSAVAGLVFSTEGKVLLVKQYRSAVGKETWEIPAGCLDVEGEDKEKALLRELKEEAHIEAFNIEGIEEVVEYYPMLGASDYKMYIYAVYTNIEAIDIDIPDDADVTATKWVSIEELRELITTGAIQDGKTTIASYEASIAFLRAIVDKI
jgi:ADP-ribose pyrophosphatase